MKADEFDGSSRSFGIELVVPKSGYFLGNLGIFKFIITFMIVVGTSSHLFAQESQGTTSTKISEAEVKSETKSGFTTNATTFEYSVNTVAPAERGNKQSLSLTLEPKYVFKTGDAIKSYFVFTEDVVSPDQPKMENTRIYLDTRDIKINETFKFTQRVGAWLPTKTDVYQDTSFRGGIDIEPQLKYKTNFLGKEVSGYYRPRYLRNFHQYTQTKTGQFNTEYTLRNRVLAEIKLNESISIGGLAQHQSAVQHSGTVKESFALMEYLTFQATDNLAFYLGHDNSGDRFESDGATENFEIMDEEQSRYFAWILITQD